ncbi:MAG: oligosaccharide flippase family protein, partial [Candidatus Latescibacterota bacterium]|nr:oligosaccharide flippase family protein [Candidatus Latescibacterota bacterium]
DFIRTYGLAAPNWKNFRPIVSMSAPLLFPQIASWSMHLADRFLLGALAGSEAVGIYAANYNLPVFVNHLTGAIFFSFTPVFARLWNTGDFDGVRNSFRQTGNAIFGIGIPMIVGMTILGPQIMTLLTTPEIASHSKQIIPFVALAYFSTALGGFGSEICMYSGRTKALAVLTILAAGLNLVLNSVMIPVWGVLGASIATLAAYTALTTATTVYARRILAFDMDLKFFCRVLFASGAMALAIISIQHSSPWLAILLIPLGAVIYGLTLYIVSGRPSRDQLFGWIRT